MTGPSDLPEDFPLSKRPATVGRNRLFFLISAAVLVLACLVPCAALVCVFIKSIKASSKQASPFPAKVETEKKSRNSKSAIRQFFRRAKKASSSLAYGGDGNVSLEISFPLDGLADTSTTVSSSADTTFNSSYGSISFDSSVVYSVDSSLDIAAGPFPLQAQLVVKVRDPCLIIWVFFNRHAGGADGAWPARSSRRRRHPIQTSLSDTVIWYAIKCP